MINENFQLTFAEVQAYESEANQMRAEAMRNGCIAVVAFVKSVAHRAIEALTRPAHIKNT